MPRSKTVINQLISFLTNIYDPSPQTDEWTLSSDSIPKQKCVGTQGSLINRSLSAALRRLSPTTFLEAVLQLLNRVPQSQSQPQLLPLPPNFILNIDLDLDEITIVASAKTVNALKPLLGERYDIVPDEGHSDEMLSISPEMCEAFLADTVSESLTIYENQSAFDFEWATRDFPSAITQEESPVGLYPASATA